ncbi:hypothetical protein [Microbulbifer sp. S227A]|uniref:hypothetical protein n=1 Tax=Microbulbifer sp. S227A TaxID=3415131 RepID=UPI003C79961D
MTRISGWIAAMVLVGAVPAAAQSPEEIVRWIYTSLAAPADGTARGLAYLTAPERRRDYLSRDLVALYDRNDENSDHGNSLATACFEQGFEIPGNDYDATEIMQSLTVSAQGDTARQRITAQFTSFGEAARIHFDFIVQDGFWRIENIGYPGWDLSDVDCAPRSAAAGGSAPATGGASYCYRADADDFRVYVNAGGVADFRLESWQGNGHSCFIQGKAQPHANGWTYQDQACRLELGITPEGGFRLSDASHACKMASCGQRAVLDGLTYGRAEQVDCATLPPPTQY